jgi:hypothetical protein
MGEISPIWRDLGRCGEISQNLMRSPAEGREAGDLRRCGVEVGVGSRKGVVEHKEGGDREDNIIFFMSRAPSTRTCWVYSVD